MQDRDYPTPQWWQERELIVFETEDEQQQAKVRAAANVLGFMLNVPSDSDDGHRYRAWFSPDDFPGPFMLIAQSIWESYDGDVEALVMRMVAAGQAGRVRGGTLVTDLYWGASLAAAEESAFILSRIRLREELVARSQAQIASIAPFMS
jgi:hypothetical protein